MRVLEEIFQIIWELGHTRSKDTKSIKRHAGNIGTYQLNLGYFLHFNLSEKSNIDKVSYFYEYWMGNYECWTGINQLVPNYISNPYLPWLCVHNFKPIYKIELGWSRNSNTVDQRTLVSEIKVIKLFNLAGGWWTSILWGSAANAENEIQSC